MNKVEFQLMFQKLNIELQNELEVSDTQNIYRMPNTEKIKSLKKEIRDLRKRFRNDRVSAQS